MITRKRAARSQNGFEKEHQRQEEGASHNDPEYKSDVMRRTYATRLTATPKHMMRTTQMHMSHSFTTVALE